MTGQGAPWEPPMGRPGADSPQRRESVRYRCAAGHFLPTDFRPPFHRDPDDWDDSCESNCRRRNA